MDNLDLSLDLNYICLYHYGKKVALLILDGLGYGKEDQSDAAFAADTPYLDYLKANYPN